MAAAPNMDDKIADFHAFLSKSDRILALLGAGLSASSGLATFRGAGGLWRNFDATSLATPEAFEDDPAFVWRFYSDRRHKALQANPNPAHYALAELARKKPNFLALSQNVDGLSQRADHPREQLKLLHGTLFEVRCVRCGHLEEDFVDPIEPSLAIPYDDSDATVKDAIRDRKELDISDPSVKITPIPVSELPTCPNCKSLLRPNVVWFGEELPPKTLDEIEVYLGHHDSWVDLIIVIGTSAKVYPAAGYIDEARMRGARVCVINMDTNDAPRSGWQQGDWLFQGDAAELVPKLLEPIIGNLKLPHQA